MAASNSDAAEKVASVYELLENILCYLPPEDVLFAQRVCRNWKDLIHQSAALQQTLFLKAEPVTMLWRKDAAGKTQLVNLHGNENLIDSEEDTAVRINTLLFPPLEFRSPEGSCLCVFCRPQHLILDTLDLGAEWMEPSNVYSAQHMFLTQPPATEIYARAYNMTGEEVVEKDICRCDGVTVRDLIELVQPEPGLVLAGWSLHFPGTMFMIDEDEKKSEHGSHSGR